MCIYSELDTCHFNWGGTGSLVGSCYSTVKTNIKHHPASYTRHAIVARLSVASVFISLLAGCFHIVSLIVLFKKWILLTAPGLISLILESMATIIHREN